MSSSIQPSPIEEKKNIEKPKETSIGDMFKNLGSDVVKLSLLILTGVCMLYSGKVYQSGVLTTDTNCEPYTDKPRAILKNTNSFIDVVKEYDDATKKTTINGLILNFTYDGVTKYKLNENNIQDFVVDFPESVKTTLLSENSIFSGIFTNLDNKLGELYTLLGNPDENQKAKIRQNLMSVIEVYDSNYFKNKKLVDDAYMLGIGYLKSWIHGKEGNAETTSPIWMYLGQIQQDIFVFFAKYNRMLYETIVTVLPESWVIFAAPMLLMMAMPFIGPIITICIVIYLILLPFINVSYLLYTLQTSKDGKEKQWAWPKDDEYVSYLWYPLYLIAAFILTLFGVLPTIVGIITFIMIIKVFFLPLYMTAHKLQRHDTKITEEESLIDYKFSDALLNAFIYKRQIIMIILSIYIFFIIFGNFGGLGIISFVFACIFIYMFIGNIYDQYVPSQEDNNFYQPIPLNVYNSKQHVEYKKCPEDVFNPAENKEGKPTSWLTWGLGIIGSFANMKKHSSTKNTDNRDNRDGKSKQAQAQAPAPTTPPKTAPTTPVNKSNS